MATKEFTTYDFKISIPSLEIQSKIKKFISIHNVTASGNRTLLSDETLQRYFYSEGMLFLSYIKNTSDIESMMLILLVPYLINGKPKDIPYGNFLCVHLLHRGKGIARKLITKAKKYMLEKYNIGEYYFMSDTPKEENNKKIDFWFRSIRQHACMGVFSLEDFKKTGDHTNIRNKMRYHVNTPHCNIKRAEVEDKAFIESIFKNKNIKVNLNKFQKLSKIFDIYCVWDDPKLRQKCDSVRKNSVIFMFPNTVFFSKENKKLNIKYLSLMLGNAVDCAAYVVSKENGKIKEDKDKYDLIYGWCNGDTDQETIKCCKRAIKADINQVFINYSNINPKFDTFLLC